MEAFLKEIEEKTDRRITGKVFHGGVLGSQPDAINQVRLGAIDFGECNLRPMGTVRPETTVVSLPFVFKSIPQMYRAMRGEIGDALAAAMEPKGLVALG